MNIYSEEGETIHNYKTYKTNKTNKSGKSDKKEDLEKNIRESNKLISFINNNNIPSVIGRLIEPWAKIGLLRFNHIESIILAHVDLIANITDHYGGYFIQQTNNDNPNIHTLIINDAPGGFTDYLTWRRDDLYGFIMSAHNDENNQPNASYSDENYMHERMRVWKGSDKSGNIITNIDSTIALIEENMIEGFDIIIVRLKQIDLHNILWKEIKIRGEIISKNEYYTCVASILVMIGSMSIMGKACIEFPETFSEKSKELIYTLSLLFNKIMIIKPETSVIYDKRAYIFVEGIKMQHDEEKAIQDELEEGKSIINISKYKHLEKIKKDLEMIMKDVHFYEDKKLYSSYPEKFDSWLNINNKIILKNQYNHLVLIMELFSCYSSFNNNKITDIPANLLYKSPYSGMDRVKHIIDLRLNDTLIEYLLTSSVISY